MTKNKQCSIDDLMIVIMNDPDSPLEDVEIPPNIMCNGCPKKAKHSVIVKNMEMKEDKELYRLCDEHFYQVKRYGPKSKSQFERSYEELEVGINADWTYRLRFRENRL